MLTIETVQKNPKPGDDEELIKPANEGVQYDLDPRKILTQILHRPNEQIHRMLMDSTYQWVDQGMAVMRLEDPFGGWINTTRNHQSQIFLKREKFEWLCLIDADVGVPWYGPYQLISHGAPVVSAIVPGWTKEKGMFACVAVKDEKGVARFPTLSKTKILPKAGLVECHNAGAGCIVIRRDVLETMWDRYDKDPEFGQPFELSMDEMRQSGKNGAMRRGEDICFTDRARECGFKVFADFGVRCVHQKMFQMHWPDDAVADITVEDWAISALDYKVVPA